MKIIEDVLCRLSLPLSDCRGQCYDGASSMSGRLSGVQARIREKCEKALYVHCCAHSLNLALQDASRSVSMIRDILDLVRDLNNVVRASAKRRGIFEKIRNELDNGELANSPHSLHSLRPLCPTRWTVRAKSMQSVIENYEAILTTLDTISSQDKTDSGSKAAGLAKAFLRFTNYFALKLGVRVFEQAEELSCLLQKKSISATAAKRAADVLVNSLQSIRSYDHFNSFWTDTLAETANFGLEEPEIPRRRRPPCRIDSGSETANFQKPDDYYRSVYFEFIDCAIGCISSRFAQSSFDVYTRTESVLLNTFCESGDLISPDYFDHDIGFNMVADHFSGDIDKNRLKVQLSMLASSLSKKDADVTIDDVVAQVRGLGKAKIMFTEICKLLRLLLTIPVASATAERSFSALRRLKTYTRSTMTAARLTHIALLHVHQDRTDKLNDELTMQAFVSAVDLREETFGKF